MPRRFRLASQALITYSGRPSAILPPRPPRLPNLVATNTSERRPAMAWPTTASLCPKPYMSEVSKSVTPRSIASRMRSIPARSSLAPYMLDSDMQPKPMAETAADAIARVSMMECSVTFIPLNACAPRRSQPRCARSHIAKSRRNVDVLYIERLLPLPACGER